MTTTHDAAVHCPSCTGTDLIPNNDGTLFCLTCRFEFDPRAVIAPPAPVAEPAGPTTVDEVLARPLELVADDRVTTAAGTLQAGELPDYEVSVCDICGRSDPHDHPEEYPDPTPEQAEAFLESLVGTRVLLEGGQWATLVGFEDDDHARIMLDSDAPLPLEPDEIERINALAVIGAPGDPNARRPVCEWCWTVHPADACASVVIDFNDILRHEPVAPAELELEVEIDDETAWMVGDGVLMFAALIIEAGLRSLKGTGADAELITPPTGFLPDDGDAIPLLEQGAAVAVAMLCKAFDLPRDVIEASLEKVRPSTREGDDNGGNSQ